MVSRPLWRKLGRDLWGRKGALASLLVIVAVGVGAFVGMAGVWRDLDSARAAYYRDYRLADFSVELKRAPYASLDEVVAIINVRSVRARISLGVLIDMPSHPEPLTGTAISMPATPQPVLNDLLLRSGAWFSGAIEPEVILNDAFAVAHGIRPGDRLKVLLLDKQHELLVVGTAMSPEFVYLIPGDGGFVPDPARFGVLYLQQDFLQRSGDLEGAYNQLIGRVFDDDKTVLANTLELIADRLDAYGVTQTTQGRDQPSVSYLRDELAGLEIQSRIMPGLFLGVAALVLNVLIGRLVAQQRTVIGTLRALGYSVWAMIAHYVAYGLLLGALGGVAGVALGWWIQSAMIDLYREFFALPELALHVYPDLALTGLAISVVFAVLGTLKGVAVAARLAPADAMRPPPPEKGGKVLPERLPLLWRRVSFRGKLMLRTVFRNPFRSLVSVLASVIATAIIFTAFSMTDSLDYLMNYEFTRVAHQDITIVLREPTARQVADEVLRLQAGAGAEPQLSIGADLSFGAYRRRIGITGLIQNNRLFTPLDHAGNPIAIPERGLILATKLAELLQVEPGDTLRLRPLIGRRTEVAAEVVATVDTFFGLAAYADIDYLSRLVGEESVVNAVLGATDDGEDALYAALKERPAVLGVSERTRALEQLNETFGETMGAMIGVMVLFAGLIAFGSVLNAALVSLSERQREVGTLRVLGYSPEQVTGLFVGESVLLNGLGVLLGLFAGSGLAYVISVAHSTELYRFPVVILPQSLMISAVLMVVFVGVAQLIVYRMIRRLNWLDVLNVKE